MVWALVLATLLPPGPASAAERPDIRLGAPELISGSAAGLELVDGGRALMLARVPLIRDDPELPVFGVAESAPLELAGPSSVAALRVEADAPAGTRVHAEVRGRIAGRWTEWSDTRRFADLEGITALQTRVTLLATSAHASPRVSRILGRTEAWSGVHAAQVTAGRRVPRVSRILGRTEAWSGVHAAQVTAAAASPTVTLMATRIGMVGRTTANGHVITERDHFVALPSKRALSSRGGSDYMVQITYRGKTATVPVWDIGPWNIADDYWNESRERFAELPRWTSQAEAAYFANHNGGRDGYGRTVILPNSIDIADGTFWDDLGMTGNDWVDVTFLWVSAPSPPRRPTPAVAPKTATAPSAPTTPQSLPARAASFNAPMPGSPVYLPFVTQDSSGWTSSWSIQNPSGAAVTGTAELYDATGASAGQVPFSLPPWGSDTFTVADALGPVTFMGSIVIRSSGAVAVTVNCDNPGMDRMSYEAVPSGASLLAAPLIARERDGWSTGIQVQNLGQVPTVARVTYTGPSGGVADESATIGPMASHIFFQPANPALPRGYVGSATIQSMNAQPLAAVVAGTASSGAAVSYAAIAVGSDSLYAPILYRRYNGWDSSMHIQNLNPSPARVTILYQGSGPTSAGGSETVTIPGGGSVALNQATQPMLSDGFVGSARIQGEPGARLVGVVREVQSNGASAMSYVLGRSPSMTVAAPLITKASDGWSAGIQALNPGPVAVGVMLTVYDESGGQVYSLQEVIEPGGSRTYYPPSIPEIPAGFRGSATIQATTGHPIVAVVNETAR